MKRKLKRCSKRSHLKGIIDNECQFLAIICNSGKEEIHVRSKHQPISMIFCTESIPVPVIIQGTAKHGGENDNSIKLLFSRHFFLQGQNVLDEEIRVILLYRFLNFQNWDLCTF